MFFVYVISSCRGYYSKATQQWENVMESTDFPVIQHDNLLKVM